MSDHTRTRLGSYTRTLCSLPDIFRSSVLSARTSSDGVSNGILPTTNHDANIIFFVLFIGIFPTLTRKALGAVCPLYGSVDTLHHGISSCFSTSSSGQDTQSNTGKTGSTGLRVCPFEFVEMVVEHRDRVAGPQLMLGAETGAGAVLAVRPSQVLRKLSKSNARDLKLVSTLVISEGDSLGLLGIIPEHQMRISPGRFRCFHLECVVVVAVRVGGSPFSVPFRQSPQQSRAKTSAGWLLELRKIFLLFLHLLGVLDDGVPVKGSTKVHLQDG